MTNMTWNRRNGVVTTLTIASCTLMQDQLTAAGHIFLLLLVRTELFYVADYPVIE